MKIKLLVNAMVLLCCGFIVMQSSQCLATNKHRQTNNHSASVKFTQKNGAYFNPTQKKAIQSIVHEYLIQNPKVLMEMTQALQTMREQEMVKMQDQTKNLIGKYAKNLLDTKNNIAIGNPNGNIAMVEFFDYQCGNCKMMMDPIDKMVKSNSDLEVIFISWPFFGPDSVYAAKAVLAAREQGKQIELHNALLATENPLNREKVDQTAKSIGLDVEKLHKGIEQKSLDNIIKNNFQLAQNLKLVATPAFIFLNRQGNKADFVLGRVGEKVLQQAIDKIKN